MKNVVVGKHRKARRPVGASGLACLVATFSASIAAVMLSISLGLSWPEYLSLTLTAAALTFGVVFTIFEMRRLTDKRI
jgi:Kef-type K+ transport system membrane component KefB